MNKLVFLSFLILVLYIITTCNGINDQNKNKRRKNEDECSLRRCCSTRKKFRNKMNNDNIINCKLLTDRECGKYDEFCEWNCNGAGNGDDNDSPFIKKYHGISSFGGSYQEPSYDKKKNDDKNKNKNKKQEFESYDDYIKDSKFISIDDCGVMYEVEIPSDIINERWKNQEMKEIAAGEKPLRNDQDLPRRLNGILGPDGRWETTSTDYPYSTVLFLTFDTPGGLKRCTATMISKRWALTAAHCVWGNSDWYSNFKLFSHIDNCFEVGTSNLFGDYFSWSTVWMLNAYVNEQIFEYDMAMIQIDESNSGLGYLGYGYDLGMTYEYMNMISHPADKDCDKMVQNNCPWNKFNENTFETKECDVTGGASGSAVYKNDAAYGVLVGAVIFNDNPADANNFNVASRITPARYNLLCTAIEQDEPGRCGNQRISGLSGPPAPFSWFKPYQTGRSWQLFVEGGSSKSYEFFLIGIGMLILLNLVCITKYYWNNTNKKVKYNQVSMDSDSDQI